MPMHRLFRIAPALARLIQKERGGARVVEGYFSDQPQRKIFVQIEGSRSRLVLEPGEGAAAEEQADLPPAHAQALLAISQGQVEYVHTRLAIGPHEIQALHFVRPGPLDLVMVPVALQDEQDWPPLPWFGPEVSTEPIYQRRRLALDGAPDVPDVDVTNAALNSLLDLLEDRFTTWPEPHEVAGSDAPAAGVAPSVAAPVSVPETEADEEIDARGIEDAVIRELARSLQPRRN